MAEYHHNSGVVLVWYLATMGGSKMEWVNQVDVVDALTGAPIDISNKIWVCTKCMCRYQEESMSVIKQDNAGHCISCGGNKFEEE